MAFGVHVSDHAVKRFRYRCSEGAPWPEFTDNEIRQWISRMVIENASDARYYRTHNKRAHSLIVPLRDAGAMLAVAIVAHSRHPGTEVAVTTIYSPEWEATFMGSIQGFLPAWWQEWTAKVTRGA